jgi:hypothetical protein
VLHQRMMWSLVSASLYCCLAGPGNDMKKDNDAVDMQEKPAFSVNRVARRRDEQTATDDDSSGQQRDVFVPIAVSSSGQACCKPPFLIKQGHQRHVKLCTCQAIVHALSSMHTSGRRLQDLPERLFTSGMPCLYLYVHDSTQTKACT